MQGPTLPRWDPEGGTPPPHLQVGPSAGEETCPHLPPYLQVDRDLRRQGRWGWGDYGTYSLRCTRTVGTVLAPDAPRRWSDCTFPPYRRRPADGQPPASRRYLASVPGTPRRGDPDVFRLTLGCPPKENRKKTRQILNRKRESAAFRNSAPQFFDPHPPLPLGPQRCPLGTLATVRGTTAAVAPQDCNGRAAVHGALAPDRPVHTAVPREHSPNQYM